MQVPKQQTASFSMVVETMQHNQMYIYACFFYFNADNKTCHSDSQQFYQLWRNKYTCNCCTEDKRQTPETHSLMSLPATIHYSNANCTQTSVLILSLLVGILAILSILFSTALLYAYWMVKNLQQKNNSSDVHVHK